MQHIGSGTVEVPDHVVYSDRPVTEINDNHYGVEDDGENTPATVAMFLLMAQVLVLSF